MLIYKRAFIAALLAVLTAHAVLAQPAAPPAVASPPAVPPPHAAAPRASSAAARAVPAPAAPVDINAATAAELGKVRFIGRKRAAAIVAGRPWKQTDELVAKKILPQKYYDQIKDHLVVK